jgi:hypothetical protein
MKELKAEFEGQAEDVQMYQLDSCARCIVTRLERHLTMLAPDSLKAGVFSLPESVKVENALPAESG